VTEGSVPIDNLGHLWRVVRDWLTLKSLPLWAREGFSEDRGVFQERLTLEGQPILNAPRRLMVQARQIYSYAVAEQRHWMPGAGALVSEAARSMVRDYYQADGQQGWVRSVDAVGKIVDPTRDFYAHSFALFGLAAAFQSTRDDYYLAVADNTLRFLDSAMRHRAGGYVTQLPPCPGREMMQNPHMHLLEALMALYQVAPREDYRLRSQELISLLERHLFRPSAGILGEYFTSKWLPVDGDRGRLFEPGHHYEWVWLLGRYIRLFQCSLPVCTSLLLATANTKGISPEGLVWAEVREDGLVLDASIRLWPHTESMKAELSLGSADAYVRADRWLRVLYETFLAPAYPGGWHDRIDGQCRLLTDCMPASSLYHLVCALSEYEKFRIAL
jgi:mannose/cellobiose epimerase-like protein (N-acyl-D-glucosamine 2-epimerase family)